MQSRLDILQKAAQYVENLQQENGTPRTFWNVYDHSEQEISPAPSSPLKSSPEFIAEDNCTTDKQTSNESIRTRGANDVNTPTESFLSKHFHHHSNGENKLPLSNHSSDSPGIPLSGRKRSSPRHTTFESDCHPQGVTSPRQIGNQPTAATQPNTQESTANRVMSFVPPLAYQGFDPALYASILARQGLNKPSNDGLTQSQSPGPSPCSALPNGNAHNQELQHLMHNLNNPALLMGHPGVVPPGMGRTDTPLLTPPYLAAYGQAANMLSQLASYGSVSDRDRETKRVLETMTQSLPSQFLANPYFKPVLDPPNVQDKTIPKSRFPADGGLPAGVSPDTMNYLLSYQEALNNEILKFNPALYQSYMPSRSSVSPEITQKTTALSRNAFPVPFRVPYSSSSTRSKSPVSERNSATATTKHLKNGRYYHEPRSEKFPAPENEASFPDERKLHFEGNHSTRRLATTTQRSQNGAIDPYPALFKNSHSSGSHRNNRWEDYRQNSEERSTSGPFLPENSARKRSYEQFGIPPDLIPDSKINSPRSQTSASEKRFSKTLQDARSGSSPADHSTQQAATADAFGAFTGKSGLGLSEKDAAAYLASAYPYMFHPAMMGVSPLPANPYVLPAEFNPVAASNNPVADSIAASLAAASPLFRTPIPTEALPEHVRLVGIAPYISLLNSQQQALNLDGSIPKSSPSQNYAAEALKQTALQQSLREGKEKEQHSRPSHPSLASMRPFLPNLISSESSRNSPNLNHKKTIPKHSSQHLLTSSICSSTSSVWPLSKSRDTDNIMIKHERSPEKQGLNAASTHAHPKVTTSPMRRLDQDRSNLKRGADTPDDATIKRKREVTANADAPDVDEHFRRSLQGTYRDFKAGQNTVSITGTVEDHFKKSLGKEVWCKTKSSSKPGSSDVGEGGRDSIVGKIVSSHSHSSSSAQNLSQFSATNESLHPYQESLKMFAGNALLKARETILSESVSKIPSTTGSSPVYSDRVLSDSAGTSLRRLVDPTSFSPGSKEGPELHPNFSPQKSCRLSSPSPDFQSKPSARHVSGSPHSTLSPASEKSYGLSLSNFVQNHASLKVQTSPYTSSPLDDGSYTNSPTRPSPAYSPHSSASASSRPPTTSPRRISVDGRACGNPKPSAPMPVHT